MRRKKGGLGWLLHMRRRTTKKDKKGGRIDRREENECENNGHANQGIVL